MKGLLIVFIFAFFLISCHPENREYVKHKDLSPGVEWLKKDVREFKVPVDDINTAYDMFLTFRYASGFRHQFVKVQVTEIHPNESENVSTYELKVREDNGQYIGDPGYDIWDSEHLVEAGKLYEEAGTYTYRIEHIMPVDPLNFAMEIGLILDRVESSVSE